MKGIYVLLLSIDKDISVNVGALGRVNFEEGMYAYVGSAQNSLEKRITRHLRKDKKRFWHIDYLLASDRVKVHRVFYAVARRAEECNVAEGLCKRGFPTKGFGSSDCHCKSHLFRIPDCGFIKESMQELIP